MYIGEEVYKQFMMILLNRANNVLKTVAISEGGAAGTVADPKKIFKMPLDNNAAAVVLRHNHPSGNLKPSEGDIKLTRKIMAADVVVEINVLDHIIVGMNNYFSFADEVIM